MCSGPPVVMGCGQRANWFIERRRQINRHAGQIDAHRVGGDGDSIPGEGGDVFCALGEDDDQDRGEAVAG